VTKALVLLPGPERLLAPRDLDLDPRLAQPLQPTPGDLRGRILGRGHDAPDTGGDDRLRAGAGAADVAAGLESDVEGGTARALARRPQRHDLRVRAACSLVPALADDLAARDQHGADDGVRVGRSAPPLRELERAFQERLAAHPSAPSRRW
jgi:hypothetical protein